MQVTDELRALENRRHGLWPLPMPYPLFLFVEGFPVIAA
jgi:hypothetical protein